MRGGRGLDVGLSSLQRGDLRATEVGSAGLDAVEDRPGVPVHLVHRPWHQGRLLERLDAPAVVPLVLGRERRPGRDELVQRLPIQVINFRLEHGHAAMMRVQRSTFKVQVRKAWSRGRHGACKRTDEEAAVILALLALGAVAGLAIGAEIRLGVKAID